MTGDDLFSLPEYREGRHRKDDWATSKAGAESVAFRAGTQKALLLEAYTRVYPEGLTDEEAARAAGLRMSSEYSKRCGELRQDGHIAPMVSESGETLTREGSSGVARIMSTWQEIPIKPLKSDSIQVRPCNQPEVLMLTESEANILIDGQKVLVGQVVRALETNDEDTPETTAERVISTVANWLSDYRPSGIGSEFNAPLDTTAFILRRGQSREG